MPRGRVQARLDDLFTYDVVLLRGATVLASQKMAVNAVAIGRSWDSEGGGSGRASVRVWAKADADIERGDVFAWNGQTFSVEFVGVEAGMTIDPDAVVRVATCVAQDA